MMLHRFPPAPYAPRRGYLIPVISLALSASALLCILSAGVLAVANALTGYTLSVSAPPLKSPLSHAALVCYIIFGPMLGLILCLSQRGLAEQRYGSNLLLGYRMKRFNAIALTIAGVATAATALTVLLLFLGKALSGG